MYLEGEGVFPWGPGGIFLPHLVSPLSWLLFFFSGKGMIFPFILLTFTVAVVHTIYVCVVILRIFNICDYLMNGQTCL